MKGASGGVVEQLTRQSFKGAAVGYMQNMCIL